MINKKLLIYFLFFLLGSGLQANSLKQFVVVVDAGHGGHDPGAHGSFCNEKDVTLSIALKLGSELSRIPNVRVIYTRTTDVFIELATRAQIANDAKADLFISIHCNSAKSSASGTETWVLGTEDNRQNDNFSVVQRENSVIYLEDNYEKTYDGFNPNSPEDIIAMTLIQDAHYDNSLYMAQLVEDEFRYDNRYSRGVKQSGFAVLWRTAMPSILIETGFISNYTEGAYICSDSGQNEISQSVVAAFKKYKNVWDKKYNNSPTITNNPPPKPIEKPLEDGFYTVQILATQNLYAPNAPQLKGLKEVQIIKSGNFYKYYFGNAKLKSQNDEDLKTAKSKGFTSAYSVTIKNKDNNWYQIQLFSSDKKYGSNNSIFDGFTEVQREKNDIGPRFSYYTQKVESYTEAQKMLALALKNGFSQAILVMGPKVK